jgi:uncharacterized membrane protein YbhN (UPF0104 family)
VQVLQRLDKRVAVVLLASGALLVWFVSGLHVQDMAAAFRGVDPGWVAMAVVAGLADYALRAVRWTFLVRHVDRNVRLDTLWRGVAIGAALNALLPLRGGDIVRPAFVSHQRRVPFTTLLSTTVVERLLDLVAIVGALLIMIAWMPPAIVGDPANLVRLQWWGGAASVVAVGGFTLALLLVTRRAREGMMVLLRPWPGPVRRRVMRTFLQLSHGLEAAGHPLRLLPGLAATAAAWTATAGMVGATLQALGMEPTLALGLFVSVAMTLSVAIPQGPGFLGLFQVVMEEAAKLWGVPEGVAEAEAFLLWGVYVVPITLVGAVYAWREGHAFIGVRSAAAARRDVLAEAESDAGISP